MKKYISLLFLALIMASCQDFKYDNMPNDAIYFPKNSLQEKTFVVMSDNHYVHQIWVHKGGFLQKRFAGALSIDYNYLVEYNAQNNTNYEMLDEKYYSFGRDFVIEEGANETAIPITLDTKQILADFGFTTVYIPIGVKSRTADKDAYAAKSQFILALTFKQPLIKIDTDWKGVCRKDFMGTEGNYEFDITTALDVKAPENFQVIYSRDESLVSAGELMLDAQYYTYEESVLLKQNDEYAENYLNVNVAQMPDGEWVIPVRISASNHQIAAEANISSLKLTVSKGSLNAVTPSGDNLQGNKIVLSSKSGNTVKIADIIGINATISVNETWVRPHIENDQLIIDFDENTTNDDRTAIVTVRNTANNLTKAIPVMQAAARFGIPLNKEIWSVEAFSANCEKKVKDFPMIFDGKWRKSGNELDSYLELGERTDPNDPYVLTFNLGMEQSLNDFGLMPRQQWAKPVPKRIKIEVSTDNVTWTAVGKGKDSFGVLAAFTEAESNAPSYSGKIHWFPFESTVKAKYIRLSMYETYWNNNVCCIEEVFASLK